MDDSPRSSKRRKLDTPAPKASSPLVRSTLRKSSTRLAGQRAQETPTRRSGRKSGAASVEETDVYDDIEGALPAFGQSPRLHKSPDTQAPVSSKPTPKRTPRKKTREPLDPSLPHPFKSNPGTPAKTPADVRVQQDEKAPATSTPSRRTRSTPRAGAAQSSPVKGVGRTPLKTSAKPDDSDSDDDGSLDQLHPIAGDRASPSKRASSRKATPSAKGRKRVAAPESDDELGDGTPQTAKDRRRANRTDHTGNEEDQVTGVLDAAEPSPFNKPTPTSVKTDATALLEGTLPAGRELDLLKTIVLERITSKRPVPVVGLDEECKTVHQLVEHTITAGEGNSMLLIGARGSGKTALVNKVLSDVSRDNAGDYHVVRLNGFIHTDDKIALREIWRQLGKEMDIEEDGRLAKNYADTLTTLLALLSHPSEQTGELTDQVAKAVIFVMDEFDLFALHPRQTLLYNLFDIAQSRKAPIAVLGLTTRIDVTNSLEKRVKSRFSHRYVHLSLPKTFTAFQECCKASLIIEQHQLSVEERSILCTASKAAPAKRKNTLKSTARDILTIWNANVASLFASKSFLTTHLAPHFYLTKSVPVALSSFLIPIATLSPSTSICPSTSASLTAPDSKLHLLSSLSTLSLSLLIAAARLDIIHDSDTCNFNMAYDEYVTLASKARIQSAAGGISASGAVSKVWGKDVARRDWEGLVDLGLIIPVVTGQIGGFGMCRCDVSLEEVGVVLDREGIEKALQRWCRQL